MRTSSLPFCLWSSLCVGLSGFSSTIFAKAPDSEVVAVSARASPDYKREKRPDGSFAPESYTFGKGGRWANSEADPSIDKIPFMDIAHVLAEPLAQRKYVSSVDPKTTKLLIMVYWGKTDVPPNSGDSVEAQNVSHASSQLADAKSSQDPRRIKDAIDDLADAANMEGLENRQRDKLNAQNADMLGYDEAWKNTAEFQTGPLSYLHRDLVEELEDRRYFVVMMAYDFQLLWKQKKRKLLWETRFSIRDHGNAFDQSLRAMTLKASKYFGQDTHGIVHKEVPDGKVDYGELKVLDKPKAN